MDRKNARLQFLIILALVSEALYISIASVGDLGHHIPTYLFCFALLFIIYWISSVTFFDFKPTAGFKKVKRPAEAASPIARMSWLTNFVSNFKGQAELSKKEMLTVGLLFGIVFRLTLLFTPPSLSDDIYRYVWDGRVAAHGINPFQYPPNAEEIRSLRDDVVYPKINHKDVSTIYPPVDQLIFLGVYKVLPSVRGFKLAFILFDLLTIGALFLILKRLSISATRLLLYVWNPLVIVEFAGSGHSDIIGIFFMVVSIWLLLASRFIWTNAVLVLSFLTKFISALFLPLIVFLKKKNRIVLLLMFIALTALLYLPYADAGERLFTGLMVYSSKWRFNASIFEVIFQAVKSLLPDSLVVKYMIAPYDYAATAETIATRGADLALLVAKGIVVVIFIGWLAYYLKRLPRDLSREGNVWIFKFGLIVLGAFFILNPTLQPWYVAWLMPLLVVAPNRAWILFTGLVGLSYWILIDYRQLGVWQESTWVRLVEYVPFYLLLAYDSVRTKLQK